MDIQAEKLELVQAILNIEDIDLIEEVKKLIFEREVAHDWFDDLSDEQRASIDIGLEQADRGEFLSQEAAAAKLRI